MSGTPASSYSDADDLFARAQAGDEAAWETLFNSCYDKVRRAASRRLPPQLRSIYDSTDVAASVFSSLYAKSDRFAFRSVEELRRHLTHAARQKVIDEYRRQNRVKRRRDREEPLDGGAGVGHDPAAPTPTPSQFAQARETREQLLGMSPGPATTVLALKERGDTNEEVARETGLHLRTVQRIVQNVKKAYDSWQLRGAPRP